MSSGRSGIEWRRWWGFVLLCALAAARWTAADLVPGAAPGTLSLAVGTASACLCLVTWAGVRRERLAPPELLRSAAAGALMLCGPVLPLLVRIPALEPGSLAIALALTPVVVAVARPAFRQTHAPELAGRLWPGLAAVAGLLLLLPEPSLAGTREVLVLISAPALTGIGAAWLRSTAGPGLWRAAAACAGAAIVLLLAAAMSRQIAAHNLASTLLASSLDGLLSWLSVLALLRLGATRWSAQFEIVPLLVLLEGLVSMPTAPDVRVVAGMLLIGVASVFLLLPPRPEESPAHAAAS